LAARAISPPAASAVLHQLQKGAELLGRQGQIFPHRGEGFAILILMGHGEHDQPGQQRLGLFVPMRFRLLAGRVHHQGFGQRGGILAQVEAFRVESRPRGL
jgi:hypothetical protein